MDDHLITGRIGEDAAVKWLTLHGHRIVDRNFRTKFGEIDIISVDKFGITVFTEVKTVRLLGSKKPSILNAEKSFPHTIPRPDRDDYSEDAVGRAEDNYTHAKARKFRRAAQAYANDHPELIDDNRGYRLDLIALTIYDDGVVLKYYDNV